MQPVAPTIDFEQRVLFERAWAPVDTHRTRRDGPLLAWLAVSVESPLTVADARELVVTALERESLLSPATLKVRGVEVRRFWRHLSHHGVRVVSAVTPEIADDFIRGAARCGSRFGVPAGSTQRNRRAAVRYVFEVLRGVGFQVGDPTLDLGVVEDRARRAKLVTDALIARLQAAAPHELVASRRAVVLALGQAGATNTEITRVVCGDVDLAAGTVSLGGGTRIEPRTNRLTNWGVRVLTDICVDDSDPIMQLLPIGAASAAATVSNSMSDLCQAAGIRPRVTVEGVRAWRARRLFGYSQSIEDVARFLGVRSLDVACDVVGYDWRVNA